MVLIMTISYMVMSMCTWDCGLVLCRLYFEVPAIVNDLDMCLLIMLFENIGMFLALSVAIKP